VGSDFGAVVLFPVPSEVPPQIAAGEVGALDRVRLLGGQCVALLILIIASPLMLGVAWLIRRDGGPATFAHYRVGCGGRLFRCIKFRTMRADAEPALRHLLQTNADLRAEWERSQKLVNDPRVTPAGRWLRRLSLDELPQLLNVLHGDMALVGPRPITVPELRRYGRVRWEYLSVPPGMTGLWQVSGRNWTTYERRVELDHVYVKNRSAWLDLKILAKTVLVVLTREGAC
jgi:lipopolysaccharide/colanic/teichoic acid biosynthesis glycosyltransferase